LFWSNIGIIKIDSIAIVLIFCDVKI